MKTVITNRELSETEQVVSQTLAEWGVKYTAIYTGEAKKDDWAHDTWVIVLANKGVSERFDYRTGLGHRKMTAQSQRRYEAEKPTSEGRLRYLKAELEQPVLPAAGSVLSSLILDSSAANEAFLNWCSDFGYSTDSIKARNTYDACCVIAQQLSHVFTKEQIADLQTLLKDY